MLGERYLSVEETAKYLKVGRNTAYKLCQQPDFPTARVGRKILVDKQLLDTVWMPNKQRIMLKGGYIRK